jgi:hypothetical protein
VVPQSSGYQPTTLQDAITQRTVIVIVTIVGIWYLTSSGWLLCVLCCSIDKVPKVTSPVLVIHGTEDEVIDFSHGLAIYERCPRAVEPLWVDVCIEYVLSSLKLEWQSNIWYSD